MRKPRGLFVGLTTVDLVHRIDDWAGPDEKVTASGQEIGAGGPAAIAAVAFAVLGGQATLVSALGTHPLAGLARADLEACGVTVVDVAAHVKVELPVSAVRVSAGTGARSITSPDATIATLAELDAPADLDNLVDEAQVVLLDGHYPRLTTAVASAADRAGCPVLVDAGRWRPVLADVLPSASFAIATATYETPPGQPPLPDPHARSHGSGPMTWSRGGDHGEIPIAAVDGGDTLGAGDVLHGAATFAIATLGPDAARDRWPDVLRFAADVATARVRHVGMRAWRDDSKLHEGVLDGEHDWL